MINRPKLSPKEEKLLKRCMINVKQVSRGFIATQQLKKVLQLLGEKSPEKIIMGNAREIVCDNWPFKITRLRKLINGQRP